MREIIICTATQRYTFGNDAAMDLLHHVRRDGGEHRAAAEQTLLAAINGTAVAIKWSEVAKGSVLSAINAWLTTEGASEIPQPVMSLRHELIRDLRIAPFDDDSPNTA